MPSVAGLLRMAEAHAGRAWGKPQFRILVRTQASRAVSKGWFRFILRSARATAAALDNASSELANTQVTSAWSLLPSPRKTDNLLREGCFHAFSCTFARCSPRRCVPRGMGEKRRVERETDAQREGNSKRERERERES